MKIKKYAIFIFTLFILFVIPLTMHADGYGINATISNPFNGGNDLLSLLTAILNKVVMPIAAVVAVFYIIYAGFQYVQARGNPTKITEAHNRLLWTLIGVGVLLGAAGISAVLQTTVKSFLQ